MNNTIKVPIYIFYNHRRGVVRMKWQWGIATALVGACLFGQGGDVSAKQVLSSSAKSALQKIAKTGGTKGISVRDAKTGETLYSYQGTKKFTPASNMKILTVTAALNELGENYRFQTTVKMTGTLKKNGTLDGDLYLVGQGDPSLQKKHLQSIAKSLKTKGVKKITGKVYGDDSYFDRNYYAPGILEADKSMYYGAKVSALTLSPNDYYGTGTVYQGSRRVPLKNPTQYTMTTFKSALTSAGIKGVSQTYQLKKAPKKATVLVQHQSPKLASIIVPFMKLSDNAVVDVLVKTLGQATFQKGTNADGVLAIKKYAKANGVNTKNWTFIDGSGMAHANKVTPQEMTSYLYKEQKKPYYAAFLASLPVGGKSGSMVGGTLAGRLSGLGGGTVQAKTGTLEYGTHTLSGYVTQRDGDKVIVSVLTKGSSRSYVDQVYRAIVKD